MAEVRGAEQNLLMSKWGPMPVWAWALITLVLAWLYSKYRALQQAAAGTTTATTSSTTAAGAAQSQAVAPQWIIEDNLPAENDNTNVSVSVPGTPSAPVPVPPSGGGTLISEPVGGWAPNPPPTSAPPPPPKPKTKPPLAYKVHPGDTLSGIAQRYHTTWQALWQYNTTPGVRPASTIAELKRRGPNLLFSNETIYIPQ